MRPYAPLLLLAACGDDAVPRPRQLPDAWIVTAPTPASHALAFEATLDAPEPVEITCTLDADATEVHVVTAPASDEPHVVVQGLLPDAQYTCVAATSSTSTTLSARTAPAPDWVPEWSVSGGEPWGAYVLLNHSLGGEAEGNLQKLLIIDRDGGLRWSMLAPEPVPDLDAQYLGDGTLLFGGGHGIVPTRIDLAGEPLWVGPTSSTGLPYHHHTEQLATGEVLTMAHASVTDGVDTWDGFTIEVIDPLTNERSWTWNSQQAVDAGTLPVPAVGAEDPYHANSVQRLDDGDFLVSAFGLGQLLRIDGDTGEILWKLGPGGDFALLGADGLPVEDADWFYRSHAPEREGDHVLIYDNGLGRPGGGSSRVLELALDEDARTATIAWSWTEEGWYTPIWGDVDRLPNGGVLVTKTHCAFCGDVPEDQRLEVIELDRETGPVWRLTFTDASDAGYRAQAIDGCALFANRRYCAE